MPLSKRWWTPLQSCRSRVGFCLETFATAIRSHTARHSFLACVRSISSHMRMLYISHVRCMPSIHLFTLVHTASSHNTCTPNRTYANHSLNHLLLWIFKTPPIPSLGPSLPHAACVPRTTSCCRASSSNCWCASPPFFLCGIPEYVGLRAHYRRVNWPAR